jgi:hypothetical protein
MSRQSFVSVFSSGETGTILSGEGVIPAQEQDRACSRAHASKRRSINSTLTIPQVCRLHTGRGAGPDLASSVTPSLEGRELRRVVRSAGGDEHYVHGVYWCRTYQGGSATRVCLPVLERRRRSCVSTRLPGERASFASTNAGVSMARNRLIDDEEYDRLMFAFGQAAEEDEAADDAQAQYDGAYTTPGRDDHSYFNAYRTPQRPSPSPKCVRSTLQTLCRPALAPSLVGKG